MVVLQPLSEGHDKSMEVLSWLIVVSLDQTNLKPNKLPPFTVTCITGISVWNNKSHSHTYRDSVCFSPPNVFSQSAGLNKEILLVLFKSRSLIGIANISFYLLKFIERWKIVWLNLNVKLFVVCKLDGFTIDKIGDGIFWLSFFVG